MHAQGIAVNHVGTGTIKGARHGVTVAIAAWIIILRDDFKRLPTVIRVNPQSTAIKGQRGGWKSS